MKRCPQCHRVETDKALKFCRVDGTPLVTAATSEPESATMALPASRPSEEITSGRLRVTTSIDVLPFANMSNDPENEYFCDGLAEELLNALAKIENLKVAARTSSFSFKAKNANVDEIGRALHVNSVLEGSVRKSGNRLRITVQLINAVDSYQLWSERYDRELKDIFAVQDEITLAVVDALKLKLLGDAKEAVLKRHHTKDSAAYFTIWTSTSRSGSSSGRSSSTRTIHRLGPGMGCSFCSGLRDVNRKAVMSFCGSYKLIHCPAKRTSSSPSPALAAVACQRPWNTVERELSSIPIRTWRIGASPPPWPAMLSMKRPRRWQSGH